MAKTTTATGASDVKLAYEEKLFRQAITPAYFSKFMGEGEDNIVQVKTQLEKMPGDTIRFHLLRKLTGPGITGASGMAMEGNEEKLTITSLDIVLDEICNAVRNKRGMDTKRPFWDLEAEARSALKNWGTEKVDQMAFDALFASTPTKIFYGGDTATSLATLTTADLPAPAKLSKIKPWLVTGGNRAQNPLRPIMIGGKRYFVFLTHPDALYDFKRDPEFNQAMREAEVRGPTNPLFNDAVAVWDGFIIHEHERVPIAKTGGSGSNVPYAKGVILGAQALLWAWGKRPELIPETFDYQREYGVAFDFIAGVKKAKFTVPLGGSATDYGMVGYYTARTSISDA